jgi:FkbM family methyltransferase
MNKIAVNANPSMTRYLAQRTNILKENPIQIADVGARDGYNTEWSILGQGMNVFCFEPDEIECKRLQGSADNNVRYLASALSHSKGKQTLYEANLSYSTGLYPSHMEFFDRLLNGENARVVGEEEIEVDTLDNVLKKVGEPRLNFLKLDAEGAELDILKGASSAIEDPGMVGVLTEFRLHPEINGSPPFWQVDQFLQSKGFRLFDISTNLQSRKVMPYPGTMDYFLPDGTRFYAYTENGQVMDGDALYLRDLFIPMNREIMKELSGLDVLKFAVLYEIYHHNDAAAELIDANRDIIDPILDANLLLDLLTPILLGAKLSFNDYKKTYYHPSTMFASTSRISSTVHDESEGSLEEDSNLPRRVNDLEGRIAAMERSISWRITAPLRKLRNLISFS